MLERLIQLIIFEEARDIFAGASHARSLIMKSDGRNWHLFQ
jgi:hypothetical protein